MKNTPNNLSTNPAAALSPAGSSIPGTNAGPRPSGLLLILAFAAVYIIWGTTYLAMRFGLLGLKPFVLSTLRYGLAAVGLFAWCAIKGLTLPTGRNVRVFAISGLLMLVGGTGLVVTGEQYINSGATAVIIATEPILFLLADRHNRRAYSATTLLGIALGFTGIFLFSHYTGSGEIAGSGDISGNANVLKGSLLVFVSTVFWVAGTLYARKATVTPVASEATATSATPAASAAQAASGSAASAEPGRSPLGRALRYSPRALQALRAAAPIPNATETQVTTAPSTPAEAEPQAPTSPIAGMAIQHLAGAAASLFIAIMSGQWQTFHPATVPTAAWIGLAYLVIFGTFIAFTAFMWLMKVQPPAIVSTHTYVNPVVAVFAGWLLAGETIGIPQLLALVLVLLGIVLVQSPRKLNFFTRRPLRLFHRRPLITPRQPEAPCQPRCEPGN